MRYPFLINASLVNFVVPRSYHSRAGVPTENNLCKRLAESKGYTIELLNCLGSWISDVRCRQSKRSKLREHFNIGLL